MALGLKDLKSGRKKVNSNTSSFKRKNLRPWESFNEFDATKTQTIRAHEAVLKAQERVKEDFDKEKSSSIIDDDKVRDDYFQEKMTLAKEEELPKSSEFNLLSPSHPPFNIDESLPLHEISRIDEKKKNSAIYLETKGGLLKFIRFLFS